MVEAAELSLTLEKLTDAAEAAWPMFQVDRKAFQQCLLSCIDRKGTEAVDALLKIHATDLYLACGCALGLDAARCQFAEKYLSRIDSYLKRFQDSAIRPDDVRREVEDTLLFGRKDSRARIGQYSGRGPLENFVATAARNAALTLLRAQKHGASDEFNALASQLVSPPEGSESFVAARYEAVVRDALRDALVRLDRRQRTIVRLHLVQGVSQTQIARMLKVNQSTVSRSLDQAVQEIYRQIRSRLRELEGMNESEMQSIIRDVRSRIDLSLSRILRSTNHGG
jgi:RNA polymerase sigma-70 factor, ECF subfamily